MTTNSALNPDVLKEAFFQARLKVNRAHRHVKEAEAWFGKYTESDFCTLVEESDPQTGGQIFRVQAAPIPPNLILSIGDAFHNLSAALDYVMTGMMRAAGVSSTRVGFPTDVNRNALRKSFMPAKPGKKAPSNRRIVETFPAFVALLLHKIRPYRGGNFAVWEIRKADNIDKHNLIIPSITITQLTGIDLLDEKHNNSFQNTTATVGAGGRLNLLHYNVAGARMKITSKGKASASITFPKGAEVFAGDPVLPTLLQCIQLVAEAIDVIEKTGTKLYVRA